eukprot:CAMPEP_0172173736 /NCGR_PEP_ID=MMETSP1050-20130122/13246_1 /TAXON_ID=233186 /ORGANISM="Cryptomonas curvata, Strain CCAP979/52" /LENGTH=76 /DNA_ID=CAMNT_0012845577 /DNA_START=502 /DNA_END=732 /DNA_ORIENTATION=-
MTRSSGGSAARKGFGAGAGAGSRDDGGSSGGGDGGDPFSCEKEYGGGGGGWKPARIAPTKVCGRVDWPQPGGKGDR